jgi:hypothetical protein
MDTTLNPKQTDPRHVLVARADEELAHAYEQITRADEQIERAEEQLSKLEHKAARHPGDRPLFDRPAVRGLTGVLLAACVGVAAIALQSPYGDAAKQIIARWAPQLVLTSSLPLEKPGLPAQPSPPTVQAAAAKTAPTQPAPLAQTAREDAAAATAAALSPELAQLLQTMARSRNHGARDRAAQDQPGTTGPRHCQGFRAEPTAEDISASASADCDPDALAGADALTIPGVGHLSALRAGLRRRRRPSRTLRLVRTDDNALHGNLRLVTEP